jgi:regulator of RNase E activity RraA
MRAPHADLVARLSCLRSALVSDCLDQVGVRSNALASRIRPLSPGLRFAGRAVTVQLVAVEGVPDDRSLWYRGELQTIDALRSGDVLMTSTLTDGPFFGELLATAAIARRAAGVVVDGATRDVAQIRALGLPVFVASVNPLDSLGRLDVESANLPIDCGGVRVEPGDLVIGDDDGVVVVPKGIADEVIESAEEKSSGEDVVRDVLATGASVWDTFQQYGVI